MPQNWPAKTLFSESLGERTLIFGGFDTNWQITPLIQGSLLPLHNSRCPSRRTFDFSTVFHLLLQVLYAFTCWLWQVPFLLAHHVLLPHPLPGLPLLLCNWCPCLGHLLLCLGLLLVSLALNYFALFIPSVSFFLLSFRCVLSLNEKLLTYKFSL